MTNQKAFSYYRVSTLKQGRSGLGFDAQRKAVEDHLAIAGSQLLGELVEIESGKVDQRPQPEGGGSPSRTQGYFSSDE